MDRENSTPEEKRQLIGWAWRQLYTDAEWLALRHKPPNTWLPCPWEQFWQEEWDARTLGRASHTPYHEETMLRAAGTPTDASAEDLLRASDSETAD